MTEQLYVIMKYTKQGRFINHSHPMPKGVALGRAKAARKNKPLYDFVVEPYTDKT